jgi:hypothetical protein
VNLRLHDGDVAAEAPRDLAGFRGRECHFPARDGHTEPRENRLGLVFVDFQDV